MTLLTRTSIRRDALQKLAALSARTATIDEEKDDLNKLCRLAGSKHGTTTNGNVSAVPMTVRELEVLVALCKAAPLVQTTSDAAGLLRQLAPYSAEAHRQVFKESALYQHLPPWETLSYSLTTAILALAVNHPSLRAEALQCIQQTVSAFADSAGSGAWSVPTTEGLNQPVDPSLAARSLPAVQYTVSLLGFLDGAAEYTQAWTIDERASLVQRLRGIISDKFMISVEGALSAVRNVRVPSGTLKEWKRWVRHYASKGKLLGAMLLQQSFMRLVEESLASTLSTPIPKKSASLLNSLVARRASDKPFSSEVSPSVLETFARVVADEINLLEANEDYQQVSSAPQQRLAYQVKESSLRSFLFCSLIDPQIADPEVLVGWLETASTDSVQMADGALAQTVFKCMTAAALNSPAAASDLIRTLPRLLVHGNITPESASLAGECLALVLKQQQQDVAISTLYSLGNALSANDSGPANGSLYTDGSASFIRDDAPQTSYSVLRLSSEGALDTDAAHAAVIKAIVAIAYVLGDEKITALVISMLVQKIGRVNQSVDATIVTETAALGLCGGPNELRSLLRLYGRVAADATRQKNEPLINAVAEARVRLAYWLKKDHPLFEVYLLHLLSYNISCGDVTADRSADADFATKTIAQLLHPMAVLVSHDNSIPRFEDIEQLQDLSRNAWFNIAVHGFLLTSAAGKQRARDLLLLAMYSFPLVDERRVDQPENGLDLNTVLRRRSSNQNAAEQKAALSAAIPQCESEIKSLQYHEVVFLNAALEVSALRARAGDCTAVLPYFEEHKVRNGPLGNCMSAIAQFCVDDYLGKAMLGNSQYFSAPSIALQLVRFFEGCCHRIQRVQQASVLAADRIITRTPSAMCQKISLFALLELLSLMWKGCLDLEVDEYNWQSSYSSAKGNVNIKLSDDASYRQTTLSNLHQRARIWVQKAIDFAPLDVKGLLQAYLEDYRNDGAHEQVSLGRSFAVEMGSAIPTTDPKLTSLERQKDVRLNTASGFIAQYTSRQEDRSSEPKAENDEEWALVDHTGGVSAVEPPPHVRDEVEQLRKLAARLRRGERVAFDEAKHALRAAAGVLGIATTDRALMIQHLVGIPFAIFTRQSIRYGISLWLGAIKEDASLEPRFLVEIARGWENSVRLRKGFFSPVFQHPDPFYVKGEFAASNWETITRRQQVIRDLIDPHLDLVHLLSSHYSSSRLTSPSVENVYLRLIHVTLLHTKRTVTQPLARELHFEVVLLALRILKLSTQTDSASQWRLKDAALSAALSWFSTPPKFSFGSSRLQVKTELKVLSEVITTFQNLGPIATKSSRTLQSLQPKQELLMQLLHHEVGRLTVWITPLAHDSKGILSLGHKSTSVSETTILGLLRTAWAEDPRIAVQLATRFPSSQRIASEVRQYLVREPAKAIEEADALNLLIGTFLPKDLKEQLKYLLYWAPINPMAADTYFLPAYGNHPFIIQYAIRALESHSVDVTFFYVPQIVQTLRYDALGYVERYIIETAKFSQLFAHQIIWNMKANSYKDEDSKEPDSVKPVLDKVMDHMVGSFSKEDKDYYEREFDFFGKVTGISGTLKPLIKAPKPEKKAKIDEELHKIEVEVGCYLPSDPDGQVIGIDRKSGRPLQSHAKAPFMATFRIRKEEDDNSSQNQQNGALIKRKTTELWKACIFKVGDDCRQDVLALQLISAFRSIFNNVGLDVFVFPYRVIATAPGCGVIEVLPKSTSRDMIGREAVNGLYDWFVGKYGSEDSIQFQVARSNFIKSMAAYSIISYLLQFKDRHNGNIMIDDAGHLIHIDFGFLFDIAPGGVKFERAPFKLNQEMVAVMGGSTQSAPFKQFEELCIKAFLATRQYVEQLAHIIETMVDSGLPCFKPASVQHFKERFVLDKSDREAAEYVRKLVHISERSYSTGVYDYFQLLTNGIPY